MDEPAFPGDPQYPADRRYRCATCGFLSVRVQHLPPHTPPLGATAEDRESGNLWNALGGTARPYCFVLAADLYFEVIDAVEWTEDTDHVWERTRAVINKKRDGSAWFPWTPFVTPKEHWERRNVLLLEQQRADLQVRLAGMERESRALGERIQADSLEIARATQATMEGLRGMAAKTDRFQSRWTRAAVFLAFVALAASWLFPEQGRELGGWLLRVPSAIGDWLQSMSAAISSQVQT